MARDGSVVGEGTANRLVGRLDSSQLSRVGMPGGGEVFRGPVASRALKAVGARAMTLDRSIVVSDDFDPNRPEDQALYAHEQFHAEHGDGHGGGGGSNFRDAEEVAARAVERMVLQRDMTGGYEGGYHPGGSGAAGDPHKGADHSGRGVASGVQSAEEKPETTQSQPDPNKGYRHLVEQGYSHADILDELSRHIMNSMDERSEVQLDRHRDKKGSVV